MQFNSTGFPIFLIITFAIYWLMNRHLKLQNVFLLLVSYVFYGWWDWRFLSLIFFSSITDFVVGMKLYDTGNQKHRTILLGISLLVNLGLLGVFKYYNFFLENFVYICAMAGFKPHMASLKIILPLGISFYTFQSLSYTIDIYRKELKPTRDLIVFLAFVSFFPKMVAGPIDRAKSLIPQFTNKRTFNYNQGRDGLRLMLWGFFKKVVIADTCAKNVDYIYANYSSLDGSILLIGSVYFAIQIYCDFSGYSDIAVGTAKLFGFKLMRNFAFPYFSSNIAEFWRRWHISLSTWFRDYVYIPLGGNRGTKARVFANVMITFLLSGFWHGASWTFIIWGLLNGIYYIPFIFLKRDRKYISDKYRMQRGFNLKAMSGVAVTFFLTVIAWVFFRSQSLDEAFHYLYRMFSVNLFTLPAFSPKLENCLPLIIGFLLVEWVQRNKLHPLQFDGLPKTIRWLVYYVLALCVLNSFGEKNTFIYFQF